MRGRAFPAAPAAPGLAAPRGSRRDTVMVVAPLSPHAAQVKAAAQTLPAPLGRPRQAELLPRVAAAGTGSAVPGCAGRAVPSGFPVAVLGEVVAAAPLPGPRRAGDTALLAAWRNLALAEAPARLTRGRAGPGQKGSGALCSRGWLDCQGLGQRPPESRPGHCPSYLCSGAWFLQLGAHLLLLQAGCAAEALGAAIWTVSLLKRGVKFIYVVSKKCVPKLLLEALRDGDLNWSTNLLKAEVLNGFLFMLLLFDPLNSRQFIFTSLKR